MFYFQNMGRNYITIQATLDVPVDIAWRLWSEPEHIVRWNAASDDWHTTKAENDLQEGGRFSSRMEAKDGSMGFDFWGNYDRIVLHRHIDSTLGDGRKVKTTFSAIDNQTDIVQSFEAENENSIELQRAGWQAILNNFKSYAEANNSVPLV